MILLLVLQLLTSCIDHEYDLAKISTDDIVVGGELAAPFGVIHWQTKELFNLGDIPEIEVPIADKIENRIPLQMELDQELLKKLTQNGKLYIHSQITNIIPAEMILSLDFITPRAEKEMVTKIIANQLIKQGSAQGVTTTLESHEITADELTLLSDATMIYALFTPVHKGQKIYVTPELLEGNLSITLTLSKTEGIPLN